VRVAVTDTLGETVRLDETLEVDEEDVEAEEVGEALGVNEGECVPVKVSGVNEEDVEAEEVGEALGVNEGECVPVKVSGVNEGDVDEVKEAEALDEAEEEDEIDGVGVCGQGLLLAGDSTLNMILYNVAVLPYKSEIMYLTLKAVSKFRPEVSEIRAPLPGVSPV
jgi:hypothetical protein